MLLLITFYFFTLFDGSSVTLLIKLEILSGHFLKSSFLAGLDLVVVQC